MLTRTGSCYFALFLLGWIKTCSPWPYCSLKTDYRGVPTIQISVDVRGAIQHKVSCANLDANSLCNLEHRGLDTLNSKIFSIILILNSKSTSESVKVRRSCVGFESKIRALAVWHWPGIPKNCLGGIGNDRRNFSPGKRSFREAAGQGCTSPVTYLGKDLHLRERKKNLRLVSMSRLFQPGFIIGLSTNHCLCFHPFCLLLRAVVA